MSWTEFFLKKGGLNLHGSLNNWSYIPKSLFDDVVANTFLANGSDDVRKVRKVILRWWNSRGWVKGE